MPGVRCAHQLQPAWAQVRTAQPKDTHLATDIAPLYITREQGLPPMR